MAGRAIALFAFGVIACGGERNAKRDPTISNQPPASPPVEAGTPASAPAPDPYSSMDTGFDLYVTPPGVNRWQLDGEWRTDRLPSRIRGIAPGPHTIVIDPPAGFRGHSLVVVVESGKAPKVAIVLDPQP